MKALNSRIIVKEIEPATTTESGIILQSKKVENIVVGTVISVSESLKVEEDLGFEENSTVLFHRQSGIEIEVNGEKFISIEAKHLLVVL